MSNPPDRGPRSSTSSSARRTSSAQLTQYDVSAPHGLSNRFVDATLDPAHPRDWDASRSAFSAKVYRQILGLNPFKSSYLSLYTSLETFQDRLLTGVGAICAVAAGVPLPIISLIFGKLINAFPPSEDDVRQRISQLLGVAVAYLVVTSIYTIAFGMASEKISMNLRCRLLDCILHLDQAYLDVHDLDVNSYLTEKIDAIHNGCSEKIGIFIQSISYFVAAFVVGFILSPKLTGILLATVIPTMIIIISATSYGVSKFSKQAATHIDQAAGIAESAFASIRVVQAFDAMKRICQSYIATLERSKTSSIRKAIISAVQMGAIFFTAYGINGLAFYVGSKQAASGDSAGQAGTVFAVVLLILDSSFVVAQFAPFINIFARAAAAREDMQTLFDVRASADSARKSRLNAEKDVISGDHSVRFTNIEFAYPARATVKTLRSLCLEVESGSFTAIVGTSGGGKSTLVSLLAGLYDYSGQIHIGGSDIRTINLDTLRSYVTILEQEPILFSGTILENISNGLISHDLSDEDLRRKCHEACHSAGVDFLEALPLGLDTIMSNEIQLSGGQKQRICLARAIIGDSRILVADEPTSALDAHSEVLVVRALKNAASSGKTVIMIAHRLSTVLDADKVVVIGDGQVIEEGTPSALADEASVFRSLLEAQNLCPGQDISPATEASDAQTVVVNETDEDTVSSSAEKEHVQDVEVHKSDEEDISETAFANYAWQIIRPEMLYIVLGVLAAIVSGALLVGEAIIFGNLVQLLRGDVTSADFQSRANLFCAMFLVIAIVALISWTGSGAMFGISSTRTITRIKILLLQKLLYLDMEWFAQPGHSVHQLMSTFSKDASDISSLSGPALGTIFTTITSLLSGIILAHIVAWKIAIVLLSAVPVMLCAGFLRVRVLQAADDRRRRAYTLATSIAVEACRAKQTVAILQYERKCLKKYREALWVPYTKGRWFTAWSNVLLSVSFAITYFVYALAYWWGSRLVRNGEFTQKQFFTALPALLFSSQSAGQLFSLSPEIARARAACRSIVNLLRSNPTILDVDAYKSMANSQIGSKPASTDSGETLVITDMAHVEFDHVSLSYPGSPNSKALKDASFRILRGQTVAFVGPSGAGKSTTVSLIERFYDATSGVVKVDGTDVREMSVQDLRAQIGLVSQEPDLFPGTIADNIKKGAIDEATIKEQEIYDVCAQCGLHEFIQSLPEGYSTECGAAGASTLSGGQQQRLALARAMIRKPAILLLDEPTSALDAQSEQKVQEALVNASHDRTTIIVAHRLSSIKDSDCIFVFEDGRVTESGTHDELIQKQGLYWSMAKAQSLA